MFYSSCLYIFLKSRIGTCRKDYEAKCHASIVCQKNNIVYADFYTPMADDRNGLKAEYSLDGVHPNLKGYKVMDELIEKTIDETLKIK
jgi:lysophospholipase L1-like esterase